MLKVRRVLAGRFHIMAPWRRRADAWIARRRRTVAILVSLGLHALLIAFFLIGGTMSKISGGGAGGQSL
ncbi:MAG: hypothetical protein JF615_05650, partial [Asticcacaulis sp.]|nr:hypothetical protein [Asticcacaulis sp.]